LSEILYDFCISGLMTLCLHHIACHAISWGSSWSSWYPQFWK